MPNIHTPEEVIAYVNGHSFPNRYHYFCIRALIITKYGRSKKMIEMLKPNYPVSKLVKPDKPVITANDAIKFLTEKDYEKE